jgi:hypothetical protein
MIQPIISLIRMMHSETDPRQISGFCPGYGPGLDSDQFSQSARFAGYPILPCQHRCSHALLGVFKILAMLWTSLSPDRPLPSHPGISARPGPLSTMRLFLTQGSTILLSWEPNFLSYRILPCILGVSS